MANTDSRVTIHMAEVKAYKSGTVELCYEAQGHCGESRNAVT